MGFRDDFLKYVPRWGLRFVGVRIMYAWTIVLDAFADAVVHVAEAASGRGDSKALAELGRDGGIARGALEDDTDFAARFRRHKASAKKLGMSGELARQVSLVFWDSSTHDSPRVTVFRQQDTVGDGVVIAVDNGIAPDERYRNGSWNWDGETDKWFRIFIHIEDTLLSPIAPRVWGDGTKWGAAGVKWGYQLTGTQLLSVRAAIERARAGHIAIPFVMIGPPLDPEADYADLLPQLEPGAIFGPPGARSYLSPDGMGGYIKKAMGIPGQTIFYIDGFPEA